MNTLFSLNPDDSPIILITSQVEDQKKIGDLITKMKRAGDTVGLHIIDKELEA